MLNSSPSMLVTDFSMRRQQHGFSGTQEWWSYIRGTDEKNRVDQLLGAALLQPDICQRLLFDRDEDLLNAFGLSEQMKEQLRKIKADTLSEFAKAIVGKN